MDTVKQSDFFTRRERRDFLATAKMTEGTVQPCNYTEVREIVTAQQPDGVDIVPRPSSQWYRYDDVAVACLWEPQNRFATKRLSSCWVAPTWRGEGVGRALVERRVSDAKQANATRIDTYAYRTRLFKELGFRAEDKFGNGTTYLVLEVE